MAITEKDTMRASTRLAEELAAVAERLCRSTVQVRGRGPGGGSGVIWRPSGLIITNAHVVRGPRATVELSDGRVFQATLTARDTHRDLAAVAVESADLPAAPIGDSHTLRVGQLVLALGHPFGVIGALTAGIIHSVESQRWIWADVRLAPGNSGGPLADVQGRIIGINSMIDRGLALAVRSNTVERFLDGPQERAYLGVTIQPVLVPLGDTRVSGLLVLEVASRSPAEEAGLLIGDVLIGANGVLFNTQHDIAGVLDTASPGEMLQLDLIRGGKRIACDVALRAASAAPEAA